MSNVSDLTIRVLQEIREELRALRSDVNDGFAGVNGRIDAVLQIVGGHHTRLETRVTRIEDHLGLPHEP